MGGGHTFESVASHRIDVSPKQPRPSLLTLCENPPPPFPAIPAFSRLFPGFLAFSHISFPNFSDPMFLTNSPFTSLNRLFDFVKIGSPTHLSENLSLGGSARGSFPTCSSVRPISRPPAGLHSHLLNNFGPRTLDPGQSSFDYQCFAFSCHLD
jgi:hypothetical protein